MLPTASFEFWDLGSRHHAKKRRSGVTCAEHFHPLTSRPVGPSKSIPKRLFTQGKVPNCTYLEHCSPENRCHTPSPPNPRCWMVTVPRAACLPPVAASVPALAPRAACLPPAAASVPALAPRAACLPPASASVPALAPCSLSSASKVAHLSEAACGPPQLGDMQKSTRVDDVVGARRRSLGGGRGGPGGRGGRRGRRGLGVLGQNFLVLVCVSCL